VSQAEIELEGTLPAKPGERRKRLFALARRLKAVMPDAPPAELRAVVQEWHRRCRDVVGKGFADLWGEFLVGWERVRFPAGEQGQVEATVERARAQGPPARALELYPDDPPALLLASLCRELQRAVGDAAFYLDARTAGRVIGLPRMAAWRLLTTVFVADGIVTLVRRGEARPGGRANEFRYVAEGRHS
jgi:hypothetical protein